MEKLLIGLLFFSLMACQEAGNTNEQNSSDPVLEKIAGKDYAKLIELPTTAEGKIDSNQMARIVFDYRRYSFDTLYEGDKISHTFKFENKGVKDLYILETNSTCGCTVPHYSKEAIAPGEKGEITVEFNSAGKLGVQNRKVALITNSFPAEKIISLDGVVIKRND
jgi:hypothetical protein